ncbi:hypothetical protein [Hymenobacter crusticola]|uniref:Uncharacterized protein n=1 Tax=Hymenobacter crusticola TaxID=1770526 RepID=A0A243W9G5_9BACT|nr:hypothetical protein [Hymenobacter crusticola]OUJ71944.1 hypothetical protein BXP70_20195 [Hymenobacter crusticola]
MSSSPAANPADSFRQKTEAELRYLIQHPEFYHPDVVAAARRELHQRGFDTRPESTSAGTATEPEFADLPAERRWVAPALGLGLLVLALLGWHQYDASAPAARKAPKAAPAALKAVALRPVQTFDSLIITQVLRQKALLPATERADTTATRKYLLLARRYWAAENQAEDLYKQAIQNKTDDRFSGLLKMNSEQWRSLSYVLKYDHKLQPTMQKQLAVIAHAATLRAYMINEMAFQQAQGLPAFIPTTHTHRDSAFYLRQVLLGVPASHRRLTSLTPMDTPKRGDFPEGAQLVASLPEPKAGANPVYILNGKLFHSDPSSGAPPAEIRYLPTDSLGRILVVQPTAAVRYFGPQAHDGAVVVFTKGTLRFIASHPAD